MASVTDIDHYRSLATIADRGKLDAIFFADHPALKDRAQDRPWDALDPFTLITALSGVTSRIGLVAIASTTCNAPNGLARCFATFDHVSKGRAAWNAVTTANAAAAVSCKGLRENRGRCCLLERCRSQIDVSPAAMGIRTY